MNILIVSGFLGAGKTTFIQKLSEKTDKPFAVMENEYGGAGIDGNLLEQNRLKVWEMTEGCVCCSLKSDFAMSVLTIANTVAPDYLVVEPTGVGMLSSVIANLRKIEYDRIRLLKPRTVVDIDCIDSYLTTFEKFYVDQIKNAAHIVVSKTENKSAAEIEKAVRTLAALNNEADITAKPYDSLDTAWWNELFDITKNAFTGKGSGVIMSAEQLYSLNPDVIVLPTSNGYHPPRELYESPDFQILQELKAVKNKRVYAMPWSPMNCARRVEYPIDMLIIAKAAYPDKFKDIKVHTFVLQFYKDVYNVSDKDAEALRSEQILDWTVEYDF